MRLRPNSPVNVTLMKYLIIQIQDFRFPVPFPDLLSHADLAAGYKSKPHCKIVSAGFFSSENTEDGPVATTYGHSDSLNLGRKPEDAKLLTAMLQGGDTALAIAQAEVIEKEHSDWQTLMEHSFDHNNHNISLTNK
jgi:hypothetical protein